MCFSLRCTSPELSCFSQPRVLTAEGQRWMAFRRVGGQGLQTSPGTHTSMRSGSLRSPDVPYFNLFLTFMSVSFFSVRFRWSDSPVPDSPEKSDVHLVASSPPPQVVALGWFWVVLDL